MENETWVPIKGFEGFYEVSDLGRVRSIDRMVTYINGRKRMFYGQIMGISMSGPGTKYCKVNMHRNGQRVGHMAIHRLVALHFIGDPPEGKNICCHNDGNPLNNRASNLRWDTQQSNMLDVIKHGGAKHNPKRLSKEDTIYIQNSRETLDQLAKRFGVHQVTISKHRHKKLDN